MSQTYNNIQPKIGGLYCFSFKYHRLKIGPSIYVDKDQYGNMIFIELDGLRKFTMNQNVFNVNWDIEDLLSNSQDPV